MILTAGQPTRVARHEKALPLVIDPCPDKSADNTRLREHPDRLRSDRTRLDLRRCDPHHGYTPDVLMPNLRRREAEGARARRSRASGQVTALRVDRLDATRPSA